jgi:hypothetical protein
MNKSRLVWGIICLALAVVIGVLYLVLPADQMVFTVGDANMPYIPAIILGILGIVLLATARRGEAEEEKPAEAAKPKPVQDPAKAVLNKRLETVAWGLFLVMFGGYMLIPHTVIAEGVWSIAVGLIMLGLNAARYLNQIKMSGFTTFLGVVSVIGGVLQLTMLKNLEGAILLIVLGAYLVLRPWFDERKLFGKAEEA